MPPRLPPTGSPAASGPAQVVAVAGLMDDFVGNAVCSVAVRAVERFTFFR
jgi:hypothetical protein